MAVTRPEALKRIAPAILLFIVRGSGLTGIQRLLVIARDASPYVAKSGGHWERCAFCLASQGRFANGGIFFCKEPRPYCRAAERRVREESRRRRFSHVPFATTTIRSWLLIAPGRGFIRLAELGLSLPAGAQQAGSPLSMTGWKPVLLASELAVSRGPGEGDHVADVGHAGDEHQHALKTHPEARMRDRAVFPQIRIPAVGFGVEIVLGEVA